MTVSTMLCFLGASVALTLAPGPDNIFVVTQGVSRGRKAAIASAWGMCSGVGVHTLAAALGISALFYSSAVAFQIVKYAGAAYLLFLAWRTIQEHKELISSQVKTEMALTALYRRGFLMNVLNPKVAMFFLAFLPQFVEKEAGSVAGQMVLLGLIFMAQAVILFTGIGYFSGSLGRYILSKPSLSKVFTWLSAGIFTALGIRLALAER